MNLDDQLAALAAGELDDDAARALRARVAADPALARRLRRIERIDEALTGWDVEPMGADAVAALDGAVNEALAALDDAPLRPATAGTTTARSGGAEVTSLDGARQRRAARRGLPSWVGSAAVAAVVFGIVGVAAFQGLGGMSSDDTEDSLAGEATVESLDTDDSAADTAGDASDGDMDDGAADMAEESAMADQDGAALPPRAAATLREDGLQLTTDELTAFAAAVAQEHSATRTGDDASDDAGGQTTGADTAYSDDELRCVRDAIERVGGEPVDAVDAVDAVVAFVGTGTLDDVAALVVVVRQPGSDPDDPDAPVTLFAYEPGSCRLLASATTG